LTWRRNLFAVTTASFIGFTGFTLVMPFLPLYFRELGVEDVGEIALWSGVSLGVTPAMTAILAPFWGRLADRFGRKIMVERSLVSFVFVMAAMAYVREPWHVLALRAVQGLFAGYGALALTMAAESAPRDRVGYAIGFVQTAQRLGPALGPIIGGVVAQLVGLRNAFFVTSSFYAVAVLVVFFMYDEKRVGAAAQQAQEPVTFRSILAFENFILLMVVVFALQFIDRSFGPILPIYVAELGTPLDRVPLVAGLLFSIAAGSAALGNQLSARLLRRTSARAAIAGSAAIGAVGAAVYVFAPSAAWLVPGTLLFGTAMGTATTAAYTAASGVIPPSARGTGFGLLTTGSLTGLAISPIASGFLAALSIRAVFIVDAVALLVLARLVWRLMVISPLQPTEAPVAGEV
jgi:DHA1 family multidrug resistance protein-like MFS transporter